MGADEELFRGQDVAPDGGAAAYPAGPSSTGDAAVDDVLDRLQAVPELGDAAKAEAYEQLHDDLLRELNTEHS